MTFLMDICSLKVMELCYIMIMEWHYITNGFDNCIVLQQQNYWNYITITEFGNMGTPSIYYHYRIMLY